MVRKKIFDLSKKYPEFQKGYLYKNFKKFIQIYGLKFKIKYKHILIHIIIKKVKLLNGGFYYSMIYDIPHRTTHLTPFIINFNQSNETYIANIQKTDNLSGTQLVQICLEINRILGAEKTFLSDGAHVQCDKTNDSMDLSFIKLLERNKTFYMNLGFHFENSNNINEVNNLIKNIRSIQTKDLIQEFETSLDLIIKIIKDNYKKKLEIIIDNSSLTKIDEIYSENPRSKIKNILIECMDVLNILYKYKNVNKFYKILVQTFKESCDEYSILSNYIVDNSRIKLIYNHKTISRDYIRNFNFLKFYRHTSEYSYTFW